MSKILHIYQADEYALFEHGSKFSCNYIYPETNCFMVPWILNRDNLETFI